MEREIKITTVMRRAYYTSFALVVAVFSALSGMAFFVVYRFTQANPTLAHSVTQLASACGCGTVAGTISRGWGTTALVAGTLAAFWAVIALVRMGKISWDTLAFHRNTALHLVPTPERVYRAARFLGITQTIATIDSLDPVVFSRGMFTGQLVISTGALSLLTDETLLAALAHEQWHLEHHDPLKLLVARSIGALGWCLPGLPSLIEQFEAYCELAADEYARAIAGTQPLARALHAFIDASEPAPVYAHAHFAAAHLIDRRVASLVGEQVRPKAALVTLAVSLCAILSLFLFTGEVVASAQAKSASDNLARCIETSATVNPYCAGATEIVCAHSALPQQSTLASDLCGVSGNPQARVDQLTHYYYTN